VNIPSGILLDSLHLLFENCAKSLITKLTDSSSFRCSFYLGRHITHFENILGDCLIPHFIQPPRSLKERAFWKARDFQNYVFYFCVPSLYVSLFYKQNVSDEYAFHFLTFVIATKYCYSPLARLTKDKIKCLFSYFHSRLFE